MRSGPTVRLAICGSPSSVVARMSPVPSFEAVRLVMPPLVKVKLPRLLGIPNGCTGRHNLRADLMEWRPRCQNRLSESLLSVISDLDDSSQAGRAVLPGAAHGRVARDDELRKLRVLTVDVEIQFGQTVQLTEAAERQPGVVHQFAAATG